jgi:hypothetical protein
VKLARAVRLAGASRSADAGECHKKPGMEAIKHALALKAPTQVRQINEIIRQNRPMSNIHLQLVTHECLGQAS